MKSRNSLLSHVGKEWWGKCWVVGKKSESTVKFTFYSRSLVGYAPAFVPASYSARNNGRSAFTERQELELERQNAIFTVHFDRQQKYYTSWPILKGFLN